MDNEDSSSWPISLRLTSSCFVVYVADSPESLLHQCRHDKGVNVGSIQDLVDLPWVLWPYFVNERINWLGIWFDIWVYVIYIVILSMGMLLVCKIISFSSTTLTNQNIYSICRNIHLLAAFQHRNPHSDPYPWILKFMWWVTILAVRSIWIKDPG